MASPVHCIYCFEVLAAELEDREPLSFQQTEASWSEYQGKSTNTSNGDIAAATDEYPIFVTWNSAKPGQHARLRGCKGTFTAASLAEQLSEFSLIAALDDTRFRPVTLAELPNLTCGVTILHSFQPIEDPLGWTIGQHGIRVAFQDAKGKVYRATYLPDVASEQGWTQQEALESAARKAGWEGKLKDVKGLTVTTYEGWKEKVGYEEFAEWRHWVEEEREG